MYRALTVSIRIIGGGVNGHFENCVAIAQIVMEALMPELLHHVLGITNRSATVANKSNR